jgi:hypothetical protein
MTRWAYMPFLPAWSLPVVALQWLVGGRYIWRFDVASLAGIWLGPLPLEALLCYLLTAAMVVQGFVIAWAAWDDRHALVSHSQRSAAAPLAFPLARYLRRPPPARHRVQKPPPPAARRRHAHDAARWLSARLRRAPPSRRQRREVAYLPHVRAMKLASGRHHSRSRPDSRSAHCSAHPFRWSRSPSSSGS